MIVIDAKTQRFPLGKACITPNAMVALKAHGLEPASFLQRHASGDWGDVSPKDAQRNEAACEGEDMVHSVYTLPGSERLWVMTEWDRSVTTLLCHPTTEKHMAKTKASQKQLLRFNGLVFEQRPSQLPLGATTQRHGFYKNTSRGVLLYDQQGQVKAFLVSNPEQGHFAVTAFQTSQGIRYMHSTTEAEARWLGLDALTYSQGMEAVRAMRYELAQDAESAAT